MECIDSFNENGDMDVRLLVGLLVVDVLGDLECGLPALIFVCLVFDVGWISTPSDDKVDDDDVFLGTGIR